MIREPYIVDEESMMEDLWIAEQPLMTLQEILDYAEIGYHCNLRTLSPLGLRHRFLYMTNREGS